MATVTDSLDLRLTRHESSRERHRTSVGGRDTAPSIPTAVGGVIGVAATVFMFTALPLTIPIALALVFVVFIAKLIAEKSPCTLLEGFATSLRNM